MGHIKAAWSYHFNAPCLLQFVWKDCYAKILKHSHVMLEQTSVYHTLSQSCYMFTGMGNSNVDDIIFLFYKFYSNIERKPHLIFKISERIYKFKM